MVGRGDKKGDGVLEKDGMSVGDTDTLATSVAEIKAESVTIKESDAMFEATGTTTPESVADNERVSERRTRTEPDWVTEGEKDRESEKEGKSVGTRDSVNERSGETVSVGETVKDSDETRESEGRRESVWETLFELMTKSEDRRASL